MVNADVHGCAFRSSTLVNWICAVGVSHRNLYNVHTDVYNRVRIHMYAYYYHNGRYHYVGVIIFASVIPATVYSGAPQIRSTERRHQWLRRP